MNRDEILEFLEENELSDIKEISYEGEELIIALNIILMVLKLKQPMNMPMRV